jgi:hypothetical protein
MEQNANGGIVGSGRWIRCYILENGAIPDEFISLLQILNMSDEILFPGRRRVEVWDMQRNDRHHVWVCPVEMGAIILCQHNPLAQLRRQGRSGLRIVRRAKGQPDSASAIACRMSQRSAECEKRHHRGRHQRRSDRDFRCRPASLRSSTSLRERGNAKSRPCEIRHVETFRRGDVCGVLLVRTT